MSIVITGAIGEFGRLVIADLLAAGVPAASIIAMGRSKEKTADLAEMGVRLCMADYDRPETLTGVLRAEDRVLLISGTDVGRRAAHHAVVVDAAKAAGVAQVAYTSVLGGPKADFLLAVDHRETEQAILDSGLQHTFLRNGWYSENYFTDFASMVERGAIVNGVAPDSLVASAALADYAAAAALVMNSDGHLNKAYELSGDTAWTFGEFAEEVSWQTSRTVVHTALSAAEHKELLVSVGLPETCAEILADLDSAINRGALAGMSGELSRLIGRPTTPIADTIAAAMTA